MEILKVVELLPGEYTILSYESKKSRYGITYIITAEYENKDIVSFWSNGYLTDYINSYNPKKKFQVVVHEHKIDIVGYTRKVVLK